MMTNCAPTRYFLGANTSEGFCSWYEDFLPAETGAFLWYIKGGPGNGKSTLMRRVARAAEERGMKVEYAFCSGDPDSLDGVYLREAGIGYVDATSPHVQEPAEPGAGGQYLDLSGCYRPGLGERRGEIREWFRLYREQYARSYELFRAAALASPDGIPGLIAPKERKAAQKLAEELAATLVSAEGGCREEHRFLSAHTAQGRVSFWEGLEAERFYTLEDPLGLGDTVLQALRRRSRELGCRVILCPDPLRPRRLEGLILPEQSLAFRAVTPGASRPTRGTELLISGSGQGRELCSGEDYRRCRAAQAELLSLAEDALARAKQLHDRLEEVYRPYVDFTAVDTLTDQQIRQL